MTGSHTPLITLEMLQGQSAAMVYFLLFTAGAAATGYLLSTALYPGAPHRRPRLAAWPLISYAAVVLPCTLLGATGHLRPAPVAAATILIFAAALAAFMRRNQTATPDLPCDPHPGGGLPDWVFRPFAAICVPILFLVFVWGVIAPPPPWDAFVYHLPFAAAWVQDGTISLVTVPFGDQAGTYFPSNTELYFAWLMIPLRSELLCSAAQFPFYAGAAYLVYAIARELGRGMAAAALAACLGLLLPGFMHQAATAEVDVVFAALFLMSLYFLLRAIRTREIRDIALSGLAAGLFAGTKYIGAPFVLLLALPAAAVLLKRKQWSALPLYALLGVFGGGYWYLRNWAVTGNPVFPLAMSLFGIEIFPGGYARDTMLRSIFHSENPRQWLTAMRATTGLPLGIMLTASIPCGALLAAADKTSHRSRAVYTTLLPAAIIVLFAFAVPYNLESRFTYAAWLLACVSAAFILDARHTAIRWAALAACAVTAAAAVASNEFLLSHAIMLMDIQRGGGGLIGEELALAMQPGAVLLGASIAGAALGILILRGGGRAAVRAAGAVILVPCIAGALLSPFVILPRYRSYRHAYAPEFHLGHAWWFLDQYQAAAGPRPARIAYTGSDLTFGLYGAYLENRVVHAAVHAHAEWKFHDCVNALKRSGEYAPPDTDRIDFCRRNPAPDAWVRNLDHQDVDFVFIPRLHQNDRPHLDHDPQGFPTERRWADERPQLFRLIYPAPGHPNPQVRIYRFTGPHTSSGAR